MTVPTLPFSHQEYHRRLSLTRKAMDRAGLDLLVVSDPSNMAWLTGYDGWSFYVHQAVLVPLRGNLIWWGRGMDANGARRTVDLARTEIVQYPDDFVMSDTRHPMTHLAGLICDQGQTRGRIGVEMENYYYSARAHAELMAALPEARVSDATGLVNWQRGVKSAEEIAFMRKAARIAEKIVTLAIERAEPGLPKNELVAEITAAAYRGVGRDWGDYPAIVPMLPSGADASAAHLTWNGDPLRTGEATFFELAGCYRRYHVPLCRTVFLGIPPDPVKRAEAALIEGLEDGIAAARPGNRACDIANALGAAMERAGIDRGARCGYAVGLSYPPDWGERTVSLRPEDQTVLEPGMTLHFMPGIWMDSWGLEITETVLIAPDGPAQPFCSLPRKLFVKP